MKELEKGRTIETEYGHVVHLDLRHLGGKRINAKIPFVRELCLKYQNLDPIKDLIPVRPVVHYMMGGVHTDMNGATPLPGLYAAGEVACVSINGANRLGSNSLPELLVFGARAGRAAAEYASRGRDVNPSVLVQAKDEERRLEHVLLNTKGRERLADLRETMSGHNLLGPSARVADRRIATMARTADRPEVVPDRSERAPSVGPELEGRPPDAHTTDSRVCGEPGYPH